MFTKIAQSCYFQTAEETGKDTSQQGVGGEGGELWRGDVGCRGGEGVLPSLLLQPVQHLRAVHGEFLQVWATLQGQTTSDTVTNTNT